MRVRFHIPGITAQFRFDLVFADMLKKYPEYFREGVEIASVYGAFPPAIWNGGRVQFGRCDTDFIRQVIEEVNSRGIPLRFTFTNPLIEKWHLKDEYCNTIMKLADNGLNEVIVVSPVLEDYIRTKYPKYKITSSTCKRITDPEKLSEEIEKDYNIVVVDYDLNNKFDILEKLPDKQKCEILVNACCDPGCKRRSGHYANIGAQQLAFAEHIKKRPGEKFDFFSYKKYAQIGDPSTFQCCCTQRTLFEIKELSTHISPEAIWDKYVPMGFEQFKIEGRSLELFTLVEHYMYYMVKPECRDEVRLMMFFELSKNGVIRTEF